jgi:RNA 2',3'-cyclic 3'-phosphodiesterase
VAVRLFVAVNLPNRLRDRLGSALRPLAELPEIRAVRHDALHLTLHFLGHVEEQRIAAVTAALVQAAADIDRFSLELGGMGAFPNQRRPRLWWVGIGASPVLDRLRSRVVAEMTAAGYPADEAPFRPHVTVGRVRHSSSRATLDTMMRLAAEFTFQERFEVATVDLMQSELRREGPRYTVVARVPLRGGS